MAGIGYGTEFWLHNGTALTKLAGVFEVTIPQSTVDDVETTHYESPNRTREYAAGLRELGEFTVSFNLTPGDATDLLVQDFDVEGDTRAFRIILPDDLGVDERKIDGTGYSRGYARNLPLDDRKTGVLTIKVASATAETATP
jgi:hypothetical protein